MTNHVPARLGLIAALGAALLAGACAAPPATPSPAASGSGGVASAEASGAALTAAPHASGDMQATVPVDLTSSIPPIDAAVAQFTLPMEAFDYAVSLDPSLEARRAEILGSASGLLASVRTQVERQIPTPSASPAAAEPQVDAALASVRAAAADVPAVAAATADTGANYVMLGAVTVLLGQIFNRLADGAVSGPTVSGSGSMTDGGATTKMGMKVKLADKTGDSEFELSADSVVAKDASGKATTFGQGIAFGYKGRVCPDASGVAEFTSTYRTAGQTASGPTSSRELVATIRLTTNDNGDVRDVDLSIRQTAIEHKADGRVLMVETTMPLGLVSAADGHGFDVTSNREGWNTIAVRQQATQEEVLGLVRAATEDGTRFAVGAVDGAAAYFQSGGCIRIDATAPGTVKPKASTQIPVSVTHKLDGSAIAAKVTVALKGTTSVTPDVIAKAPGTVTHLAGDAATKSTITLTASSRRGRATLDLTIEASGGFTAAGGGPGITTGGPIRDLTEPFTLQGSGDGFTVDFTYTPAGDGRGGTVSYEGGGSGFEMSGSGTYTITGKDGGPLTLTQTTDGCVKGYGCKTTTETMTLTPVAAP